MKEGMTVKCAKNLNILLCIVTLPRGCRLLTIDHDYYLPEEENIGPIILISGSDHHVCNSLGGGSFMSWSQFLCPRIM